MLTTAKLSATSQRWIASLANYDFSIMQISRKVNTDADPLPRLNWHLCGLDQCDLTLSAEGVQVVCPFIWQNCKHIAIM